MAVRLQREVDLSHDRHLAALAQELRDYPAPAARDPGAADLGGIAIPLVLSMGGTRLSFLSTTTVFGTARDVTLSEVTLETFFPADEATAQALRRM